MFAVSLWLNPYISPAIRTFRSSVTATIGITLISLYAAGFLYLMVCSILYFTNRSMLMDWLAIFQAVLDGLFLDFPAWRDTQATWATLGRPDMAVFFNHVRGVSFLAALALVPFQCWGTIDLYKKLRNEPSPPPPSRVKLAGIALCVFVLFGLYCLYFLVFFDSDLFALRRRPFPEEYTMINLHQMWVMTVSANLLLGMMLAGLLYQLYIRPQASRV